LWKQLPISHEAGPPRCNYTGIDVSNYNQEKPNLADEFVIASPEGFAREVAKRENSFDAVISSHNLEHCDDREGTLSAMLLALKPGGRIYISFPSSASTGFPSRGGTLNYFDDSTHKSSPPDFDDLIRTLSERRFEVIFAAKRYRPVILYALGLLLEPVSRVLGRRVPGTWEYYGFEAIVWARRPNKS
jgi:SAM-dependent methyltransferase